MALNLRPVIGISAQLLLYPEIFPPFPPCPPFPPFPRTSYIAASYVKFLESAGARCVPIHDDTMSEDALIEILKSLNGYVLAGDGQGDIKSTYYANAKTVWNFAKQSQNSLPSSNPFPIWGIGQGFQTLMLLEVPDLLVVPTLHTTNISLTQTFISETQTDLFSGSEGKAAMESLENSALAYNNHGKCILETTFAGSALADHYKLVSTSKDGQDTSFVSTVEGTVYPFYGTQWHPEVISYEWKASLNIDRSHEAKNMSYYMANFFVEKCQLNRNKFDHPSKLIYADQTEYSATTNDPLISKFEQIYRFPQYILQAKLHQQLASQKAAKDAVIKMTEGFAAVLKHH